ncbi:hypothetical protein ACJXCR_004528 [Vibrio parahaemolyticus]|uniref:hypothetical protein n=1 Tax=Vibrio scophthalmi TaxID=45658 RepID=UPI0038732D43
MKKLIYIVTTVSSILSLVLSLDDVFLKSKLTQSFSIPEVISSGIYFGTLAFLSAIVAVVVYIATKPIKLPYPDLSNDVKRLNKEKVALQEQLSSLKKANDELQKSVGVIENQQESERALRNRIVGVLTSKQVRFEDLCSSLKLDTDDVKKVEFLQMVLGKMSEDGLISADSISRYYLIKTA